MGFDPIVWLTNKVLTIPLVLGAELKCSCGSKHRYLLLETDDIEINGVPKACVDDCEAFTNIRVNGIIKIPTFGGENSPLCYAGFKPFIILKA